MDQEFHLGDNRYRTPTGMSVATGLYPTTKTLGINSGGILAVTQGFNPQSNWRLSLRNAPDIQTLCEVLEEISQNPKSAVVRGALRDHVDPDGVIHLRKDVNKWGDTAHFEECARSWLMIDFDKVPLDDTDLINDPEGTVKRSIKKFLPECYQNVSFVWQLSSSAGIGEDNGLLSVHIWFILDRPIRHDELKTFHALKAPAVDPAPFRTVQIHYIAAPIFEDGLRDHLPKRIGLVELDAGEVSLPELPPEVVATAYRSIGKGPTGTVHGFENKLKLLGDGEGLERFHAVLIASTSSFVYGKFKWEIDIDWLKARLRDAINKAPKHEGRDVSHYLSDGYLDQNIDTAMSKFCQVVATPKYPTPTMTPEQARSEIKSSMWTAADRHFEALAAWEKVNKPYQDFFNRAYDKLEAAAERLAEKTGTVYDAAVDAVRIRRLAQQELDAAGLTQPGESPKAVLNLAVGVGLGKTEQAFNLIKYVQDTALALLESDAEVDEANKLTAATRIAYKRLTRAILPVPTHKLADEAVERARKAGLSAGPFRGRLYKIKKTGEFPMCEKPDEVQLCVDAGLPVAASMCKYRGSECEYRRSCLYYEQLKTLRRCGVVTVPHASLFHAMPSIGSRGLLIVDEQFVFDGERQRRTLLVSDLRKDNDNISVKDGDGKMVVDDELTAKLHRYREWAAEGVIENASGNLSKRTMWRIPPSVVAEAIRLEWQAVRQSPVWPGMSRKRLREALAGASAIRKMRLRVDFWNALLALVSSDGTRKSGWLIRDADSEDRVVVHVGGRASIKDGWSDGLCICLDATSAPELVQLYFPKHEVVAPPAIEAIQANVTVLQTIDKAFSASMCIPVDGLEPDELKRRENRAREVYRFILLRAVQFRGEGVDGIDVLVICQKAMEEHLRELGLPDNVEIAHFNDTRGIDRWGGVRCLMTVGRTLPSPSDVEVLTENLTGWAVEKLPEGNWYPRESAGINVGGGVGLPVLVERHPDPMVEAVRWQICEAELVQCGGRGRGVNRAAENPLQLDVLTNVCLPMKVDQPIRWDDNAPGRIEEMVALGLLPDAPAAAALVYPELWPTTNKAKMAARNARAKRPNAQSNDVPDMYSKGPLKGVKPLLKYCSRGLTPFSSKMTTSPLIGSIDTLIKTWALKPLAFGALSKMEQAQARIKRPNQRALKFKFMFDPHLIPDPKTWLADRIGLKVDVEYPYARQIAISHLAS